MDVAGDWLQSDARESSAEIATRDAQKQAAVERAALYRAVFVDSAAGRKLLAHWDAEVSNTRISVNATLSEYVAVETVRNFVRKIHDQINLTQTEGRP